MVREATDRAFKNPLHNHYDFFYNFITTLKIPLKNNYELTY